MNHYNKYEPYINPTVAKIIHDPNPRWLIHPLVSLCSDIPSISLPYLLGQEYGPFALKIKIDGLQKLAVILSSTFSSVTPFLHSLVITNCPSLYQFLPTPRPLMVIQELEFSNLGNMQVGISYLYNEG